MKKFILFIFSLFAIVSAFAQGFTVNNCKVEIFIQKEGYFDVVENYDIDFNTPKHGIFRTFQTDYTLLDEHGKEGKRKIKISNVEVPNYKFQTPPSFVQKLADNFEIKIGDKNTTLTGPHHYQIKYRVENAFLFEDNQIRFYWNIKPDGWLSIFKKIDFIIHAPEGVILNNGNCFVYSGETGTSTESTDFELDFNENILEGKSKEMFLSAPGQSVTVLMNLPKGSVHEIVPKWQFLRDYGWIFLIGILLFIYFLVWLKYGKDDHVVSAINYYPPKGIDPAMAGFLIDDKGDNSDLIALIPYWGVQGLLKMEEIPKSGFFSSADTKLTQLNPLPSNASDYEQLIFSGLFGGGSNNILLNGVQIESNNPAMDFVNQILQKNNINLNLNKGEVLISSLRNTFYTKMQSAKTLLTNKAQQYYVNESKKVQKITTVILIVLAVLLCPAFLFAFGPLAAVSVVVACVFLILMGFYMIKKNKAGNQVFADLKGFKQFIKVADENRLKMLIKEDPGYFETTMAYALSFGLFEKWTKKFDALSIQPPTWYIPANRNMFTMNHFSKSFSSNLSGMKSSLVSSPSSSGSSSSSGGGSSGGGFGGGGGGSW